MPGLWRGAIHTHEQSDPLVNDWGFSGVVSDLLELYVNAEQISRLILTEEWKVSKKPKKTAHNSFGHRQTVESQG